MREILFRGKSNWSYGNVKKGDWLYGMTISRHCYNDEEITSYYIGGGNNTIDGKTLGQYTGLTDKNGKKIFEGDIVEYKEEYGEIAYDDEQAMFNVLFDTWCTDFDHIYPYELEVIGNIHDNSELLKGEQ